MSLSALRSRLNKLLTKTTQRKQNKNKGNSPKQARIANQNPQPRRRRRAATHPNCWVKNGPMPPANSFEGKAVTVGSQILADSTQSTPFSPVENFHTLVAVVNLGRGSAVARAFHFGATQINSDDYNTAYLGATNITSSRAVKSSVVVRNSTSNLYARPGIFTLRTTQRFSVASATTPTAAELATVRQSILSNPATVYHPGFQTPECYNVPSSDPDYYEYKRKTESIMTQLFVSPTSGDINKPMTVTWIAFPYETVDGGTFNQSYKLEVYTMQKVRYSISDPIATLAKEDKIPTEAEKIAAARHAGQPHN